MVRMTEGPTNTSPKTRDIASNRIQVTDSQVAKTMNTQEEAGLYWFNWQEISDAGHTFYGNYVYENMLPPFASSIESGVSGMYDFFDGDCIIQSTLKIVASNDMEAKSLDKLQKLGSELCYVVGVFGSGNTKLADVDQTLRTKGVLGYIGMTTCFAMDFEAFDRFAGKFALCYALKIVGFLLVKFDFYLISDKQLESMGFIVQEGQI